MTEQVNTNGKSWSTRAREFVRVSSFLLNPKRGRADLLYELASTDNYLTEKTLFRNVGWWKDGPTTLDDACKALAHVAAERLELGPEDRLLDVGFGYGDQDMYWKERFQPREIVGINITKSQIDMARQRVAERGMTGVTFQMGQATKMPFPDNSFDKVVALESAFHFDTREDFFGEAFRVLRPGGRLVTLDILAQPYDHLSFWNRMMSSIGLHFWKTSPENVYPREVYEDKLRGKGFNARVESVFEHTLVPFARYTVAELAKPDVAKRFNATVAGLLQIPSEVVLGNPHGLLNLDYVLAVADKPA